MAWDKGFDFRTTDTFVTDPTDCTYVLASDTSPTTRNGATFVWTSTVSLDSRDRTTVGDARLSGINFISNGGTDAVWTLTLPATGAYDVYLAAGDQGSDQVINLTVCDNATAFITITNVNIGIADSYIDASGAIRTRAQWIADSARGGTKVTRTFASTSLVVNVKAPSGMSTTIAHLFVSQVGSSAQNIAWITA